MPFSLSPFILHFAMLDGSAGVAVSNDLFIGASDEENVLRVCSVAGGQPAGVALDLNSLTDWFKPDKKKPKAGEPDRFREADIESAAQVGDVIYWISSHARDAGKKGNPPEQRPERCRFFATKLSSGGGALPTMGPVGKGAYTKLLEDICGEAKFSTLKLDEASKLAPKVEGGFNIECLCAEQNSKRLFIGLRNPVRDGKALLLPLTNASELIGATAMKATFDEAIRLDLHGLGSRDMIWWPEHKCYLLIGGHFGEHLTDAEAPRPALFTWDGNKDGLTVKLDVELKVDNKWLNPEGLIRFPNGRILILSDDGALPGASGREQKDERDGKDGPVVPMSQLFFRSVWLEGNL